MKFCTSFAGKDSMELFIHISSTVLKLERVCVLHMCRDVYGSGLMTAGSSVMPECGMRVVWEDFLEPSVQACDASVYLPALKTLKSTIERIANLGDQVLVEENLNGNVNLRVQTDVVSIKSYFNNFGNPPKSSQDMPQDRNLENMVQVLVKSRKLLQFFEGQQINPTTVLCNVLSNTLYHVFSS
ncbi:checkpoint protein HUS1B-like [Crocuta crocuta]